MPLCHRHPPAIAISKSHTNQGEANMAEKLPKNQRIPSDERSE